MKLPCLAARQCIAADECSSDHALHSCGLPSGWILAGSKVLPACSLTDSSILPLLQMSVNFLVSLLKKNWQNVRSLHCKTTMVSPALI